MALAKYEQMVMMASGKEIIGFIVGVDDGTVVRDGLAMTAMCKGLKRYVNISG